MDINDEKIRDIPDEIGEPTREEYEKLISTVYKEFYDSDIKSAVDNMAGASEEPVLSDAEWLEIAEKYPECVREQELENPLFAALLRVLNKEIKSNPVRIYEFAHFDEMIAKAEQLGAENAEKQLLDRIRARRSRPGENGIQKTCGQIKRNVSEMTRRERAALAERAAKGEHIKL